MTTDTVETTMQSELCPACGLSFPRLAMRSRCTFCGARLMRHEGMLVVIGTPPIVSTAELEAVKKGARAAQGARS